MIFVLQMCLPERNIYYVPPSEKDQKNLQHSKQRVGEWRRKSMRERERKRERERGRDKEREREREREKERECVRERDR
jgi:hypothetical protein